ncbi:YjfB family protein [Andreprevotia chitinilytica]|uniref:YjfB family protein n=1 Tax=Andreprevotia chitinilytica TaxID=396808 RepID=UPI000558B1D6|nr:YjfB family protein [Andreprevotia chitinilytica]
MDSVSSLVNAASSATGVQAAAGTQVLRKALDLQAQTAATLLQSVPPPAQYNNPSNLGQSIDVKA